MDVMPKLRAVIGEGLDLETPVEPCGFRVVLDKEGIRLYIGDMTPRNNLYIPGDRLNKLVQYLKGKGAVRMDVIRKNEANPGTFEDYARASNISSAYSNYVAAVLSRGGFVKIVKEQGKAATVELIG